MKIVFTFLLILSLIALGIWYYIYSSVIKPAATVTDIRRYETVLAELGPGIPGLEYFPKRIPASAKDAAFFYEPHFLQGPATLRLRLTLPAAEITELEKRLRAERVPIAESDLRQLTTGGIPPGGFQSGNTKSPVSALEPFHDDCLSFLLQPDIETAKRNWNHPSNVGISISVSRNEVIYWLN